MSRLLLVALLSLVLSSCFSPKRLIHAPRPARRHYQHQQRVHERQRRREVPPRRFNSFFSWD